MLGDCFIFKLKLVTISWEIQSVFVEAEHLQRTEWGKKPINRKIVCENEFENNFRLTSSKYLHDSYVSLFSKYKFSHLCVLHICIFTCSWSAVGIFLAMDKANNLGSMDRWS